MTDTREQVERLAHMLVNANGPGSRLRQDLDGHVWRQPHHLCEEAATTLRSLLSRLEAAEAERAILRTEKHADAEALAERDAAVAGAYEAAAMALQEAADDWRSTGNELPAKKIEDEIPNIRSLTPTDAQTALDRVKEVARLEERERCADEILAFVGHWEDAEGDAASILAAKLREGK